MPQEESTNVKYFIFDNYKKMRICYYRSVYLEFKKPVCSVCFNPLYRHFSKADNAVIWHCRREGCLIQQKFPLEKERNKT